jgi:hypothetical protein
MNVQFALVFLSSSMAILTGAIIFFYFRKNPRKINFLFLILILSALPVISIFRPGSYESSDLSAHTTFAISFFKALTDGSFVPRWGMDLNYTFGYPAFLFIYVLPYYIISLLHFLGTPFLLSTKIVLALSFICSGVSMYFFAKKELGKLGGFISAIFYLYAPYHLVDLHFRADIGEIVAFVFLPLLFLTIRLLYEKQTFLYGLFVAVVFSLLILSHPAISISSLPLIAVYLFYLSMQKNKYAIRFLLRALIAFFIGILLTAFYWLPILTEVKFTSAATYGYNILFPHISEFIFSPYLGGLLFQGHKGELSFTLGYTQLIILMIIPFILIKKMLTKNQTILLSSSLLLFLVYFLLMQEISKPLWYIIPFIKNFQFSYRLLGVEVFIIAFIAGIILPLIRNKKILIFILIFTILSTILNWGNRKNVPLLNEQYLLSTVARSDINYAVMGQAIPRWADISAKRPWILSFPKSHLEVIKGNAKITEIMRKTTIHLYKIQAETTTTFQENTWYFPGWTLLDNNKNVPIKITSGDHPGLVQFTLPKGNHIISFIFLNTWDRKLANQISLITFCIVIIGLASSIASNRVHIKQK